MVVWLIGLSRSGKTTLSKAVYNKLKPEIPGLVRLDGDLMRELFGNDVDHTVDGRRKNAERLSRFSKFLAEQKIHVIAAVLSIFPEWRKWNRENIPGYAEIYIKASMAVLKNRDRDRLYAPAFEGRLKNVVGVDIPFPEPENPDLIIENDAETEDFEELSQRIISLRVVRDAIKDGR